MPFLRHVPPMGIYETLYAFRDAFGKYMGDPGTHPWSQGFPRTVQLPGGPAIPNSVSVTSSDLKYPKAWGLPALREAIAAYYRRHYGADVTYENVMIFAGGRPGLAAVLLFLEPDIRVRIPPSSSFRRTRSFGASGSSSSMRSGTAGRRSRP